MPSLVVLDTNVISEAARPNADATVTAWYRGQAADSLYTTAITQAEVFYGIELWAPGRRRHELTQFAWEFFNGVMRGKVFPLDAEAAVQYGRIRAMRRKAGVQMAPLDAQIAAIAFVHGASVATRNTNHFEGCGIRVINPWET